MRGSVAANLDAYQRGFADYLGDRAPRPSPAYAQYLDAVAGTLARGARLLELGSGPGYDAVFFEEKAMSVRRTDGTPAFVSLLQEQGHDADLLDITTDDLGGPYDAVFANAVLLHVERTWLPPLLNRIHEALRTAGVLAFTVKEGDGEAWSTAKIGLPRFFVYWREDELRELLVAAHFEVTVLEHVRGRVEPWLYLICRRA